MSNNLVIYIMEGPAGSGKSTLARELSAIRNAPLIDLRDHTRRQYSEGAVGTAEALVKDFRHIVTSLVEGGASSTPWREVVVDRMTISMMVYDYIRNKKSLVPDDIPLALASWLQLTYWVRVAMTFNHVPMPGQVTFRWCFMLPGILEIQRRRNLAGKVYPYDVEDEYLAYLKIYRSLKSRDIPLPPKTNVSFMEVANGVQDILSNR